MYRNRLINHYFKYKVLSIHRSQFSKKNPVLENKNVVFANNLKTKTIVIAIRLEGDILVYMKISLDILTLLPKMCLF